MDGIYASLQKEFGLKEKHILIVKELEDKELSAEDICRRAGIPVGRIYEYLNFLVEQGIVKRSAQRPFKYSIPDVKRSIVRFTQNRIDDLMRSQSEMMYNLRESAQQVSVVHNAMAFTQAHINMVLEGNVYRIMCIQGSFPYLLYPQDFNAFMRIRDIVTRARPTISRAGQDMAHLIYKAYQDALEAGKRLIVIFDRKTFDFHMKLFRDALGQEEFVALLNGLIQKLQAYDTDVYVVDEFNPLQIDVSEKRVSLSLRYVGVTTGIIVEGTEAVQFFTHVFDEKVKKAQDVLPLLKKMVEEH
ncbi:ArsR family transcriptional regulator [Candidatus Woesearchaeota archaeon]|nr:ArsR family transcriptional regulator [Candidatus Woesearchaeota archaeon]